MKRWIGIASCVVLFALVVAWPGRSQIVHSITINWIASTGATSYNVKRSTSIGTETTLATGVVASPYVDTAGVAGTKYFYVITAVNQWGESGPSNEVSATFLGDKPLAPTGVTAVAN